MSDSKSAINSADYIVMSNSVWAKNTNISSFWFGVQAPGMTPRAKVVIRFKDDTEITVNTTLAGLREMLAELTTAISRAIEEEANA